MKISNLRVSADLRGNIENSVTDLAKKNQLYQAKNLTKRKVDVKFHARQRHFRREKRRGLDFFRFYRVARCKLEWPLVHHDICWPRVTFLPFTQASHVLGRGDFSSVSDTYEGYKTLLLYSSCLNAASHRFTGHSKEENGSLRKICHQVQ